MWKLNNKFLIFTFEFHEVLLHQMKYYTILKHYNFLKPGDEFNPKDESGKWLYHETDLCATWEVRLGGLLIQENLVSVIS